MPLQLDSLKKSFHALTEVLEIRENGERMSGFGYFECIAIRADILKHFETTYELCLKLIACWLNKNISSGIADGMARRHRSRPAAENRLI